MKMKSATSATTLTPATVKMLKLAVDARTSPDDEFKINGVPILNVTLVGKVVDVTEKGQQIVYKLDDGTGTCDVKVWGSDSPTELVSRGCYVRVYGAVKAVGTEQMLTAHTAEAVRVITDFNEVTFHMLEVIYSSGFAAKAISSGGAAMGMAPANPYSVPTAKNTAATGNISSENLEDCILAILSPAVGEAGVHRNEIYEQLNGRFTKDEINSQLEEMANNGTIYTTTDDDHYGSVA